MPTRIYTPSSGAAAPVTPSTWNHATLAATTYTQEGKRNKAGNSSLTTRTTATGTVSPTTKAVFRYVFGPLAPNQISGTINQVMRCYESATGANATTSIAVKLIQSGGADRSVLLAATAADSAASPQEYTTTLGTRRAWTAAEARPITLTSQTPTDGDYLVVEIGIRSATTVDRSIQQVHGDPTATSDCPDSDGDTNAYVPWFEFSNDIPWQTLWPTTTISDAVTVSEAVTVRIESNIQVSDVITLSEVVTVDCIVLPVNISVSDSVTLSESRTLVVGTVIVPTITDAVTVGESVTVQVEATGGININVSDSVSVTDSVSLYVPGSRFYFPSTPIYDPGISAPVYAPKDDVVWWLGGYNFISAVISQQLANTAFAYCSFNNAYGVGYRYSILQTISHPLPAKEWTPADKLKMQFKVSADGPGHQKVSASLRVVSGDGQTVRGVLYRGDGLSMLLNGYNRGFGVCSVQNNVSMQKGDRLCLELGTYDEEAGGTWGYFRHGDVIAGTSDCPESEENLGGTDYRAWLELNTNLIETLEIRVSETIPVSESISVQVEAAPTELAISTSDSVGVSESCSTKIGDLQATPFKYFGASWYDSHGNSQASLLQGERYYNTAGNGYLESIEFEIYAAAGGGKIRLGLYSDKAGPDADALLIDAGEIDVVVGWCGISGLSGQQISISADTWYWLSCNVQNSNNQMTWRSTDGAPSKAEWHNQSYGAMPNPFGTPTSYDNLPWSARCSILPSGVTLDRVTVTESVSVQVEAAPTELAISTSDTVTVSESVTVQVGALAVSVKELGWSYVQIVAGS